MTILNFNEDGHSLSELPSTFDVDLFSSSEISQVKIFKILSLLFFLGGGGFEKTFLTKIVSYIFMVFSKILDTLYQTQGHEILILEEKKPVLIAITLNIFSISRVAYFIISDIKII